MLNKKALAASVSAGPSEYVEDVFSTYLYTGNGGTQTITNGIDLAGEGGLVWIKDRASNNHNLFDTERTGKLYSNSTLAESTGWITTYFNFTSSGFQPKLGDSEYNQNGSNFCSWTFRKAKKFFDVVTYTGNGSNRTISHNLGSVPGMIIVKRTDTTGAWQVYHRSLANTEYLVLNTTAAKATGTDRWNSTTPTSTEFSLGTNADVNANAGTYVAYLFAHDAGGFGDAGTDNIITCGSFTTDGSGNATISLGYEPQWLLAKASAISDDWYIADNMRGWTADGAFNYLLANSSGAEAPISGFYRPTATGFTVANGGANRTYIYMAIRRPMKTPTSGTSVFNGITRTGNGATTQTDTGIGFPPDLAIIKARSVGTNGFFYDRLRGDNKYLLSDNLDAEADGGLSFTSATGSIVIGGTAGWHTENGRTLIDWYFKRATGFFDIVCYTGTGSTRTVSHNLGAVPELMIIKKRTGAEAANWVVYSADVGAASGMQLNTTDIPSLDIGLFNATSPTSNVFTVRFDFGTNRSGYTYVAYLFATLAGISKVGSYTGNGSTQTINCGFTAGARFVLIKRTDLAGDWCVFDTARGIVSGNDPFLQLNSTAAEVTGEDAVDPANSGFIVNETTEALNTNNATYIYLAIA